MPWSATAMNDGNAAPLDSRDIGALIILVNQNRLSEAEHQTRTLLTGHPDAGVLWKVLGVALLRQGKDALPALRKAAQLMPNDAEAHANLGAALHDLGQWAESLASLRLALAIRPQDEEALINAANALRALGRAAESMPLYQRVLQLNPRHLEAQNNLGNALLQLGQYRHAIACYDLALKMKPDNAQILCNLANAQRLQGLLDEALVNSRAAVAMNPSLGAAYNTLGLALAALGSREDAAASYRQALALNSNDMETLNNLANVLRELGDRQEPETLYTRAIAEDPQRAESHCNLGNLLVELRRIDEATQSFRHALALRPNYALAHLSLATALRLQRRAADAEVSCRAALAIEPNNVEALSLLGELRADRGQFSEAQALFQQTVDINPNFAFGFFSIAAHRKMTSEDGAWLKGVESLLTKRPTLAGETHLHYALGKYFDDLGQFDQAFGHYSRANELTKRHESRYDGAKMALRADQIIRILDAAFSQRALDHASASELPVFIVGMPRSGTSLVEQILASHPAVFGAGEVTLWDAAFLAIQEARLAGKSGVNLIPDIAREYLARLTGSSGAARRVVDKMPTNFMYVGLIHAVFPRARIIHMQRHPIDTGLSIYFNNFFNLGPYGNDLENIASYYAEYIRITDHWRAVLPATALLEIPYEALITDQEVWTRRMLDFVGLPWDPKCLDFHQTDRVVVTASKWQVRQTIYADSSGRWKNYEKFAGPLQPLLKLSNASRIEPAAHAAP